MDGRDGGAQGLKDEMVVGMLLVLSFRCVNSYKPGRDLDL